MRTLRCFLLLLMAFSLRVSAQPLSAQVARPDAQASGNQTVMLGNAIVSLAGPWKFHTGDDMAWADPSFDDSAWGLMDLTPLPGSVDPNGGGGFVPGWTARGYAGYSGYAWYRLRVNIQGNSAQGANHALAIRMPDEFDDAYQVYVNGQLAGQFGRFKNDAVQYYAERPAAFPLPAGVGSGPVTIAIRMWMDASTPVLQQDAGGLHEPPELGQTGIIHDLLRLHWYTAYLRGASVLLELAIQPLAILIAFWLFALDRGELAYFWLGLSCTISLIFLLLFFLVDFTTWIPGNSFAVVFFAVLPPVQIGVWILFWSYWFRLERTVEMAWLYRLTWGLVLLLAAAEALQQNPLYGRVVPVHAIVWLSPVAVALTLLLELVLVWVTYQGIRRNRTEGWLALTAVLLVAISRNVPQLAVLHIPTGFWFFVVRIPLAQIGTVPSLAIITVLMLRRFLRGQREREKWKLEIEQARQVQQVLVPEAIPAVPGYTLESEYRPAQHVGGDFFQILPHQADGSLLIVVGDVTGHGLQAAMLVSLLVGAIRSEAAHSHDPLTVLNALNQRLFGRGHAHATCLALRITQDGMATLANAGHLPPYLNGKELRMEGALPLGMIEGAEFSVTHFQLAPGDTLLLMSDGVAEAQNEHGKLFGFDRIRELLQSSVTAAEIASAAQNFGQQDDILVLRVARDSTGVAGEPVAGPMLAAG